MGKNSSQGISKRRLQGRQQRAAYWSFIQAFTAGVGLCFALLAFFALLLTHTPLPLHLVQPMACLAAAAGAALSGYFLANKLARQRLLCGLGCGGFYAVCLLAAAVLVHGVPDWTRSDTMLPVALLLGGTLGGALSAMKEGR